MRITPFLCSLVHASGDLNKAIEAVAYQADMKQWPLAGLELGRVEELANRVAATVRLARDALWDESERYAEIRIADAVEKARDDTIPGDANP